MPNNLRRHLRVLIEHYRTLVPRLTTAKGDELVEVRRKIVSVENCICNALPLEKRQEALRAIRQTQWESDAERTIRALWAIFELVDAMAEQE